MVNRNNVICIIFHPEKTLQLLCRNKCIYLYVYKYINEITFPNLTLIL